MDKTRLDYNYWKTLMYLCVTAFATLAFTLGYYYIEVKLSHLYLKCSKQNLNQIHNLNSFCILKSYLNLILLTISV